MADDNLLTVAGLRAGYGGNMVDPKYTLGASIAERILDASR